MRKGIYEETNPQWLLNVALRDQVASFAEANASENPDRLRLRYASDPDRQAIFAAIDQIELKRLFRRKLPAICSNSQTLIPSRLAAEQATDEALGPLHADIAGDARSVADLTAGLGVDSLSMAASCAARSVVAFEIDPAKAEALRHNAAALGLGNLKVVNSDSTAFFMPDSENELTAYSGSANLDLIFADPARRDAEGGRVYSVADCAPDVVGMQGELLRHAQRVLLKLSPMLDLTEAIRLFPTLSVMRVVSLRGECKEVLCELSRINGLQSLECIDILADGSRRIFPLSAAEFADRIAGVRYAGKEFPADDASLAGKWLYEPSSSVMKSGAWGSLCRRYPALLKADRDTHLFLSAEHYPDFPGRVLHIKGVVDKKESRRLRGMHCNVAARNYVMKADLLISRLGVKPGGDEYLYGLRLAGKPLLLRAAQSMSR